MATGGDEQGNLVGVAEAAAILHVSRRTILNRIDTGAIPVVGQIGVGKRRRYVINRSAVETIAARDAKRNSS